MKHTARDRTPYTYLICHKPTGLLYYGSRYARGCHPTDLWATYFTSSTYVADLINEYGKDSFSFEIRKTFDSIQECLDWEERVLRRVYQSDKFLNRNCAGAIRPMFGADNPMFGKQRPDSVERMKLYNPMRDIIVAEKVGDTRKKRIQSGEITPRKLRKDECEAISKRMAESNPMRNAESLQKMRDTMVQKYGSAHPTAGSIWLANTINKTRKRIPQSDLHLYSEMDGWIRLSNKVPIPD